MNTPKTVPHTPAPWHVDNNGDILNDESLLIARPHRRQDGPHIVLCVNNHDALKAACQMALGHIEQFDTSGSRSMEYHAVTTVLRGVIGNARFYR